MIKVYAALALIALIGAAFWRYDYVVKDRNQLKANLELANFVSNQYKESVESTAKDVAESNAKLEQKTNENNSLRDAANNGTKRVYIKSVCPATQTTSTGSTEAYAELNSTARQDYFNLRQGIITLESNYALCLKQLD